MTEESDREVVMRYTKWPGLTRELSAELQRLRGGVPDVMRAFSSLANGAFAQGSLDPKTTRPGKKWPKR
jgi:hypothetical protein